MKTKSITPAMKRFVAILVAALTFILLQSPYQADAQGTLQFNRVVLVSSAQTVPAGKAWKVESATVNSAVNPPAVQGHVNSSVASILINGNTTVVYATYTAYGVPNVAWGTSGAVAASGNLTVFPIWLPAGTTLAASSNVTYVSVIEFNIIP